MLLLIVPLEILSNIVVRPVTLALRLFANMFAGHLLLILFALGGEYLLVEASPSALNIIGGVGAILMFFLVSALELLVMFLQAYVFTLLTAMYVAGADRRGALSRPRHRRTPCGPARTPDSHNFIWSTQS